MSGASHGGTVGVAAISDATLLAAYQAEVALAAHLTGDEWLVVHRRAAEYGVEILRRMRCDR